MRSTHVNAEAAGALDGGHGRGKDAVVGLWVAPLRLEKEQSPRQPATDSRMPSRPIHEQSLVSSYKRCGGVRTPE